MNQLGKLSQESQNKVIKLAAKRLALEQLKKHLRPPAAPKP